MASERGEDPVIEGQNEADDVLGLDQQIKLVKRVKVARLDNQRIFNPQTGLDYIVKHHIGVTNTIKKNDKKFQKRYAGDQRISKAAKYDHEYDNLSTVLQFYQLWCHGIFPKANFKDCIQLLRKLGSKSPQLRLYRRELIEKELEKLKIEKGIVVDNDAEPVIDSNDIVVDDALEPVAPTNQPSTEPEPEIDDDWSFMNIPKRGNGLFIGHDDDDDEDNLYTTPSTSIINASGPIEKPQLQPVDETETTEIEIPHLQSVEDTNNLVEDDPSDDPFSDDDAEEFHTMIEEEPPNENDILQDDQDLELMREMDMN